MVWSQVLEAAEPGRRADRRVPARRLLARAVAEFTGCDLTRVHLVSRCAQCGSTNHGRQRVVSPPDGPHVWVSLGRSGGVVAVACSTAPVGVDVERTDGERLNHLDAVLFAPDEERPMSTTGRARLWVRKEAVLKAMGVGLSWDPRRLHVAPGGGVWVDGRRGSDVHLCDVDGPTGYALTVCVLADRPPVVEVHHDASVRTWEVPATSVREASCGTGR